MRTVFYSLFVIALLSGANHRPDSSPPSQARVEHCQVLLISDVDVPAEESGLLVTVHAENGDEVVRGMPLVQLDDRQAQLDRLAAELERDAAKARGDDDIEVKYAIKSFELADAELSQSIEINRRSPGAVPTSEIRRQQLARHRAELQIDRSRLDLKVAGMTANVQEAAVQAAEENILRRQINAPFDGTVIEVLRQANEWVNAGDAVLRVVRLDQLWVDGFLSGADFDSAEIADRRVTVEVELARGRRARFDGRVVYVNPLIQAGNKFRLRARVENRKNGRHWLLRPGMTASMVIQMDP